MEFKKTASPDRKAARNFPALERLGLPVGLGAVICLAREALPLDGKVWSVPAGLV